MKKVLISIIVLLLVFTGVCLFRISSLTPNSTIQGTYQNIDNLSNMANMYNFSFDKTKWKLDIQNKFISEGNYKKLDDRNYFCTEDKTGRSFIISLNKDGFYYFNDEEKELVYMNKVLNYPSNMDIYNK